MDAACCGVAAWASSRAQPPPDGAAVTHRFPPAEVCVGYQEAELVAIPGDGLVVVADDEGDVGDHVRSFAPTFSAAATMRPVRASISASARVFSRGCTVTSMARDLKPSGTPAP